MAINHQPRLLLDREGVIEIAKCKNDKMYLGKSSFLLNRRRKVWHFQSQVVVFLEKSKRDPSPSPAPVSNKLVIRWSRALRKELCGEFLGKGLYEIFMLSSVFDAHKKTAFSHLNYLGFNSCFRVRLLFRVRLVILIPRFQQKFSRTIFQQKTHLSRIVWS